MKKLFVIAPRFPYPLEKGDKLRLYNQLKSLSLHFEIHLAALSDLQVNSQDYDQVKQYCETIKVFSINGKLLALKAFVSGDPFQVAYFYSRPIHKQIQLYHDEVQPDIIFYQLFRTHKYRLRTTAKMVMDLMDCFSYGYAQRAMEEPGALSIVYRLESKRIRKAEQKLKNAFDLFTIISGQDAKRINYEQPIQILPNGIDLDFFSVSTPKKKLYDLLFVGNLGYEPNIYAVKFIHKHLYPATNRLNLTINISGARPGKQIKMLHAKNFEILGWQEDIRDAYIASKVFLAPIFGGIGQQNKVLEAMSMGLPCIVSPEVARGLDIPDVEDILSVAKEPSDYLYHIQEICINENPKYLIKANAAKAYLYANRSWDAVNSQLVRCLNQLLDS